MLSTILKVQPDEVMKWAIKRDDLIKLVQGGKLIDKILDRLNFQVRQDWKEKQIQQESKLRAQGVLKATGLKAINRSVKKSLNSSKPNSGESSPAHKHQSMQEADMASWVKNICKCQKVIALQEIVIDMNRFMHLRMGLKLKHLLESKKYEIIQQRKEMFLYLNLWYKDLAETFLKVMDAYHHNPDGIKHSRDAQVMMMVTDMVKHADS